MGAAARVAKVRRCQICGNSSAGLRAEDITAHAKECKAIQRAQAAGLVVPDFSIIRLTDEEE